MRSAQVAVIGAGFGGLAAALLLAARGADVLVLERAADVGGKMRQVMVGDAAIDAGPTVFTMRHVFDALLAEAGARLEDHLRLQPLQVLARHAWDAQQRLDLHADTAASAAAIGDFAGAAAARGFLAFCDRARRIHAALDHSFMQAQRPSPASLVMRAGLRGLPALMGISPFATLWDELGRYFPDPRLRQLFGRYATYCGCSPFLAPATLMLIAHVEQSGVWRLQGGMQGIARMLRQVAEAAGARFRCNAEVSRIDIAHGRVCGIVLADGKAIAADAVICNADTAALATGLLGDAPRRAVPPADAAQRSLSAVTWMMLARAEGFPLHHHSVFFGGDYREEFDAVFRRGTMPAEPTVYLCAQDRGDGTAPAGAERLLGLVNAPPRGDRREPDAEEIARCRTKAFALLARCGLQLHPVAQVQATPRDFHALFPATGGALYGRAVHGWQASFQRPGARTRLPGLYLAGGSVHPGAGVPMAALSGRLAAEQLLADRASTRRWHKTAMPGGISMRSATTAPMG